MRPSKAYRDFWNVVMCKVPSRRLRHMMLSRMLGELGPGAFVGLNVQFLDPHNVFLAARSIVNGNCSIDARGGAVRIAGDTDIGAYTHIWTLEHDPNDPKHGVRGGEVVIGDHVWIATRVTVLPGVSIGRGAVVGTGSIVTKSVAEKAIVAGVPAKKIGQRDNPLEYELNYRPRFR